MAEIVQDSLAVECPECAAPAFLTNEGVSLGGIGFCGHEFLFPLVKLHCAKGHKFDVLDEDAAVHSPEGQPCEGARQSGRS